MIKVKKLNFGDTIYKIIRRLNYFQDKIRMTDADGIEWFRYEKDKVEYTIQQLTYCGLRTTIEIGECTLDDKPEAEYHFKLVDGSIDWYAEFDLSGDDFCNTLIEAKQKVEQFKQGNI